MNLAIQWKRYDLSHSVTLDPQCSGTHMPFPPTYLPPQIFSTGTTAIANERMDSWHLVFCSMLKGLSCHAKLVENYLGMIFGGPIALVFLLQVIAADWFSSKVRYKKASQITRCHHLMDIWTEINHPSCLIIHMIFSPTDSVPWRR